MDGQLYSMLSTFVLTFVVCCLAVWFYRRLSSDVSIVALRRPPCLTSLPVVGSLPFLGGKTGQPLNVRLTQLSHKLGPVFAFYSGTKYIVALNTRDVIREALVHKAKDFSDRPEIFTEVRYFSNKSPGIVCGRFDAAYRRRRKFYLSTLKEFGYGYQVMESRIHVEVEELLTQARKLQGRAADVKDMISRCVLNVITSIVVGRRYDFDDPILVAFRQATHDNFEYNVQILNVFPILRFLPYYRQCLSKKVAATKYIREQGGREIDACQRGESGDKDSFVTRIMNHLEHAKRSEKPDVETVDRLEIVSTFKDLLLAGADTSATTLRWMVSLLADHVNIQQRVQRELDSVVPLSSGRLPSLSDAAHLPFTEAFILEAMRLHTIVPLALPHLTTSDTSVNGFFVPAKTQVVVNLYAAHRDPKLWKDPDVFNPERFLDDSGKVVNKDDVITFSLGRRSCFGELLARQEIFLFITGLLQNFDIRPPDGQTTVDCHEVTDLITEPSPFNVRLIDRRN